MTPTRRDLPGMWLHPNMAKTLAILLDAERPLTPIEIGEADGRYPAGSRQAIADLGKHLVYHLRRYRALAVVGRSPMRFEITERGRIALALFRFKEARRAQAQPVAAAVHR